MRKDVGLGAGRSPTTEKGPDYKGLEAQLQEHRTEHHEPDLSSSSVRLL
jgi:hypothetical protein